MNLDFFKFALCEHKLRYYDNVIHSFDWNMMVVFKMRDSVPSVIY